MLLASIPAKFPIIFASQAPLGNVSYPFPTTAQPGGLASLPTGFTQINFTPVAAGGIPPWGKDANGILYQVTAWLQWLNAGGPIPFDAVFAASVGGYPSGAIISSNAGSGLGWVSQIDNNQVDPNGLPSLNWAPALFKASSNRLSAGIAAMYSFAGNPNGGLPGTATFPGVLPPDTCWDFVNNVLWVCTVSGNAAGAVWVAVNPSVSVTFPSHSVILGTGGANFNSVGPYPAIGTPFLSNGNGSDPGFGPLNLAYPAAVTGVLGVPNGGTGAANLFPNGVLLGNSGAPVTAAPPQAAGTVLTSTGPLSPPQFQALPAAAHGGFSGMLVYTFSGTFTVPAGTTVIKHRQWAGGGGGSGSSGSGAGNGCGSGGGGGGYLEACISVTPGQVLNVIVGAAGVGGGPNSNGGNGGGSAITGGYSTAGGQGGLQNQTHAAGGGFTGPGNYLGISGTRGGQGGPGTSGSGGQGGGTFGTSNMVEDEVGSTVGSPGNFPGGGGVGAPWNGSGGSGGAGAAGLVVIEW